MNNEYYKKLCKQCEIIEEADKTEFIKINVKRWKTRRRKQRGNQNKQTNEQNENK